MVIQIRNIYSGILSAILAFLGFTGCSSDSDPGYVIAEYGVPATKFKITGQVVSSKNIEKPISNIRVVITPDLKDIEKGKLNYLGDTVFTNAEGKFEIGEKYSPVFYDKHKLTLEDVDGEANGLYENKELSFLVSKEDFKQENERSILVLEKDFGKIELKQLDNTPGKE